MSQRGVAPGAVIIDGRALASQILAETVDKLQAVRGASGVAPGLRVIISGDDPASTLYARRILRTAERAGVPGAVVEVQPKADVIRATLRALSDDDEVAGVIVQLPLPVGLEPHGIIDALDPGKDLDGIHPLNAGLVARGEGGFAPSCAEAAMQVLKRSRIPIAGRPAVVVGRSNVVGKPAQLLLIQEHATVTVCHRQTRDLREQIGRAEIVVVAAGSPGLVTGDAVRPGAVVVDCGINVLEDGSVTGDVDMASVAPVASLLTPVPGGIGPVTNAVLLDHLARAALARVSGERRGIVSTAS